MHGNCAQRVLRVLPNARSHVYSLSVTPDGAAIKAHREALGMNIQQLADASGTHRSCLSRLERGLLGARPDTIHRIAQALAVKPDDITRGDDVAAPPAREVPYPGTPEGAYFHYSPEEASRFLPWGERRLRGMAREHKIPHNKGGGRISFTGQNICEISDMTAVRPLSEQSKGKRAVRAA